MEKCVVHPLKLSFMPRNVTVVVVAMVVVLLVLYASHSQVEMSSCREKERGQYYSIQSYNENEKKQIPIIYFLNYFCHLRFPKLGMATGIELP